MKNSYNKKGFTLVELIISIAILGIISTAFLSMFGFGYSNITEAGIRTKAINKTQNIIESAYAKKFYNPSEIRAFMSGHGYNNITNISNLYIQSGGNETNYFVKDTITALNGTDCYIITVVVFYKNGTKNIDVTTAIPIGGI
jgi:prepilin-type N-terminal cleavage/methylation domain-containing protein